MITADELSSILRLCRALTSGHGPTAEGYLGIDVRLSDSNGDVVGTIAWDTGVAEDVFSPERALPSA